MRLIFVHAVAAAMLAVFAAPAAAQSGAPPAMVGGYSEAEVRDPEVSAAARFAIRAVGGARARLASVDAAQRQVVQGTNYRLDLTARDGRRWRVTVYQPLRGRMQLTDRETLRRAGPRKS